MKILVFFILFINLLSFKLYAKESTFIVIKINNKIITNIDLINEENYLIALNNELQRLKKSELKKIAKESLIREKIKEDEIDKYSLEVDREYVNQIILNFLSQLNLETEQQFNEYLKNFNLTNGDIRNKIGIETRWNSLIYQKFNKQISIDRKKIEDKVKKNNQDKKIQKKYLLSEIVFEMNSGQSVDEKYKIIENEIKNLGFKNTANKFSISDTAKFGGKIGWVEEKSLSKKIYEKIKNLNTNEYSNIIRLENNYILLKVDKIKITETKIDKEREFQNLLQIERNKKLNKYSLIYFNKTKSNYIINEK